MTITPHEQYINSLIPYAELDADKAVKGKPRMEKRRGKHGVWYNHCHWTTAFHAAMNKLTRERGLRSI